jgi:VanZ family protein
MEIWECVSRGFSLRWYMVGIIFLYCAMIFWLSSRAIPDIVPRGILDFDKVLHAGCFGVLALLVWISLRTSGREYSSKILFWVPLFFSVSYGASDELHQYFVPARTYDVWDWVADCVGAAGTMLVVRRITTEAQGRREKAERG